MSELRFSGRRRPTSSSVQTGRSYREVQAEGQAELDAGCCPSCGQRLPGAEAATPAAPERLQIDAERVDKLVPTATRLAAELRRAIDDGAFDLWLAPLVVAAAPAGELILAAPAHSYRQVARRFGRVLERAVAALADRPVAVRIERCDDLTPAAGRTLGDLTTSEDA